MPHYDLDEVKAMAAASSGVFLSKTSAADYFASKTEAYAKARQAIAGLSEDAFAESVRLATHVADVYGVQIGTANWYLKLCIANDPDGPGGRQLYVISLHPLQYDLKTNGGLMKA